MDREHGTVDFYLHDMGVVSNKLPFVHEFAEDGIRVVLGRGNDGIWCFEIEGPFGHRFKVILEDELPLNGEEEWICVLWRSIPRRVMIVCNNETMYDNVIDEWTLL